MRVELLVVPDCPHEASALRLLRQALDDIGLAQVRPTMRLVATQAMADQLRFAGSPTFAVHGHDLFPVSTSRSAIACRLYGGPDGLPDLRDLRQALKRAAALATAQ